MNNLFRLLSVVLIMCFCSELAEAKKHKITSNLTWEILEDGTLIFSGKGAIPSSTYKKKTPWYKKSTQTHITRVIVDEGIFHIGDFCFQNMTFDAISLPSTLKTIGRSAFLRVCVPEIVIPTSVSAIDSDTFRNANVKTIVLPREMSSIGSNAFSSKDIEKVIMPHKLTYLEREAFSSSGISSIVIPSGITTIPDNCFRCCKKLKTVILPASVTIIKPWAFYGCGNLTDFSYFKSVKEIGEYAFQNCGFSDVILPTDTKNVGAHAFAFNENLTSFSILGNPSVKLGRQVFYFCNKLNTISIPENASIVSGKEGTFFIGTLRDKEITKGISRLYDVFYHGNVMRMSQQVTGSNCEVFGLALSTMSGLRPKAETTKASNSNHTHSSNSSTSRSSGSRSESNSGKKKSSSAQQSCSMCWGKGSCPSCGGSGVIMFSPCVNCGGSGKCPYCHGKGTVYNPASSVGWDTFNGATAAPVYSAPPASSGNNESPSEEFKRKNQEWNDQRYGEKDCHLCHGSGTCQTCSGSGRYINPLTGHYLACPNCDRNQNGKCNICHGTGKVVGVK